MYLEIINNLLKKFEPLGVEKTLSGAKLIGKAEFIAPNAWLHKIYRPLTENEIQEVENILGTNIPLSYKQLLKESNGCKFFNTTLSLDGFRRNYKRDEENIWQPFDLCITNVDERLFGASENIFFIGGYDWDGSLIYIDKISDQVKRCSVDNITPINIWQNLEIFLKEEIIRLESMFSLNGKQLNENTSTTPS